MVARTQFGGPFHFPAQAGKLLDRARFLDGTFKTFWAPKEHITGTSSYGNPTFWPAAGAPALIPRVLRYLPASNVLGGQFTVVGNLVNDFVVDGGYTNLWTSRIDSFINWQASGNTLQLAHPVLANLTANDYYATDTLNVFVNTNGLLGFTRYFTPSGGGSVYTPNMANIQADADRINLAGQQAPRYHVFVLLHDVFSPPWVNGTLDPDESVLEAAVPQLYGVTFPSLIDPDYYTYGGIVNTTDPPATTAQTIIDFLTDWYGL